MHPDPLNAPAPPEALDAVCGHRIATDGAPRLLFRGHRYFFCSSACRLAFKRAPERYADEHADAAVAVPPLVPPSTRPPSPFRVARGGGVSPTADGSQHPTPPDDDSGGRRGGD